MIVIGVDPGTKESALTVYDPARLRVVSSATEDNDTIIQQLRYLHESYRPDSILAIEQMVSTYRTAVGGETLETIWWAGRFYQDWFATSPNTVHRVPRESVRKHFAIALKANIRHVGDPEIRRAIFDRWGGKERAVGLKKSPGPLFGMKGHEYAALAVAICWSENNLGK